jgi:glycosyltransferase involved in cell wall biosynthesis
MKLVIQIPCLNEEATLPATVRDLPRMLPGFDRIEILVIDDGSRDRTAEVAIQLGVHLIKVPTTRGLAHAFMTGIEASLARGADVIVSTDADNQYVGEDVAALVAPVMRGDADVVIGARPIQAMASFSAVKKVLQRLGSWTVRKLSGTDVVDATSGFRAFSREAALRLNVFSRYTYTLETIVQAGQRDLRVVSVPIRVNTVDRASRLVRNNVDYVWRTGSALLRMSIVYRPFRSFMLPALGAFGAGTAIGARFLWYFLDAGGAAGHVQSLILAAILYGVAAALAVVAFLGDLLAINRRLLEELQLHARKARIENASSGERPESMLVEPYWQDERRRAQRSGP